MSSIDTIKICHVHCSKEGRMTKEALSAMNLAFRCSVFAVQMDVDKLRSNHQVYTVHAFIVKWFGVCCSEGYTETQEQMSCIDGTHRDTTNRTIHTLCRLLLPCPCGHPNTYKDHFNPLLLSQNANQ